jgi:hypothetical protein
LLPDIMQATVLRGWRSLGQHPQANSKSKKMITMNVCNTLGKTVQHGGHARLVLISGTAWLATSVYAVNDLPGPGVNQLNLPAVPRLPRAGLVALVSYWPSVW